MREQVIEVVERYIEAVRRNDPALISLHPDVIGVFPMNTYRGARAFLQSLEPFARIVKRVEIQELVVDGEHCVALLTIETAFGPLALAEHIHVIDGLIVFVQGYYDPRPLLNGRSEPAGAAGAA